MGSSSKAASASRWRIEQVDACRQRAQDAARKGATTTERQPSSTDNALIEKVALTTSRSALCGSRRPRVVVVDEVDAVGRGQWTSFEALDEPLTGG